jgi:polyhydroxybutyrate depolymerase
MALKKYFAIALVAIMAMVLPMASPIPAAAELASGAANTTSGLHTGWMTENYTDWTNSTWSCNRTFEYYIPTSYTNSTEVPLLFSFHGLGSNGSQQRDLTQFDVLAEQEGFIAVFPDSTNATTEGISCNVTLPSLPGAENQWNLGAGSLQSCGGVDDVGFVADMVNWFEANYAINTSRIYATGMSDGALFSYLLAFNLTDTFAGIAPVCGPMPWGFGNYTAPPITVILMQGTDDPVLDYDGYGGLGGNVTYSVNETIAFWCDIDGINMTTPGPVETVWGPSDSDGTVVHRYVYSGGTNGTQVILFKIVGGGHMWPGGKQYNLFAGAVTTHIDGSAQIWKYLPPLKYYLVVRSSYGGSATTPGHQTFANVNSDGKYMFFYPGTGLTVVNLTATPKNSKYEFVNWTGDVSTIANVNAATTIITLKPDVDHKDYEITANFQYKSVTPPTPTSSSGGGCFIATAAYGTPTAKQIDVLRAFRDDVLLKSTVGSRLVDFYYRTSPPIANFISQHSVVRTLVRELLIDPIVWVVQATGNMWQS